MQFIYAFLVGGGICAVGQLLIDKTGLTPARILTAFVVAGVVLGAFGLYQPLLAFAGEGSEKEFSRWLDEAQAWAKEAGYVEEDVIGVTKSVRRKKRK